MQPYLRTTSHRCDGTRDRYVRIEYNSATKSWDTRDEDSNFVNAMSDIKFCPYCGEELKTCTRKEAVEDFLKVMFG